MPDIAATCSSYPRGRDTLAATPYENRLSSFGMVSLGVEGCLTVNIPLVSVLIPCYNSASYICETLESVLRQTWPRIEVIVVDDGSTDGSVNVIRSFAPQGVRLIQQLNAGASSARNTAFRASSGDYIQFIDADDILAPDKIERQLVRLTSNAGCIASAEWARFSRTTKDAKFLAEAVWQDSAPLDWLALARSDGLGMLFPAIWLIPRAIVHAVGPWDETLSLGDDGEYFTRIILSADTIIFCTGARCYYRSGITGSLSRQKSRAAWASGYKALELCEHHVTARENSERMRRAFSLSWQHMAHGCYPYAPDLAESALRRAARLHEIRIRPDGGSMFRIASRLLGWRLARRLQVASGRS